MPALRLAGDKGRRPRLPWIPAFAGKTKWMPAMTRWVASEVLTVTPPLGDFAKSPRGRSSSVGGRTVRRGTMPALRLVGGKGRRYIPLSPPLWIPAPYRGTGHAFDRRNDELRGRNDQ